jgi:hypothetical protein
LVEKASSFNLLAIAFYILVPVNFRISSILRISFLKLYTKIISSSLSSIFNSSRITKATIAEIISIVKVIENFKLVKVSNKAILIISKIRILTSNKKPKKLY